MTYKKHMASLTEILAIVFISLFVVCFSWSNWNKHPLRKQVYEQTILELKLLSTAVEAYKTHYGFYPYSDGSYNGDFNFVEQLSPVAVNVEDFKRKKRPMFAKIRQSGMNCSTDDFDTLNAKPTTASDPYDCPYRYVYSKESGSFLIYSLGLDGEYGTDDDIRSDRLNE